MPIGIAHICEIHFSAGWDEQKQVIRPFLEAKLVLGKQNRGIK